MDPLEFVGRVTPRRDPKMTSRDNSVPIAVKCLKCDSFMVPVRVKFKVDTFGRIHEQFKCLKCHVTVQTSRW